MVSNEIKAPFSQPLISVDQVLSEKRGEAFEEFLNKLFEKQSQTPRSILCAMGLKGFLVPLWHAIVETKKSLKKSEKELISASLLTHYEVVDLYGRIESLTALFDGCLTSLGDGTSGSSSQIDARMEVGLRSGCRVAWSAFSVGSKLGIGGGLLPVVERLEREVGGISPSNALRDLLSTSI